MSNLELKSEPLIQIISTEQSLRSGSLLARLESQKLKFTVVDGFIPNKYEFESGKLHDKNLSRLITQRKLSIGEIGCAKAHIQAAERLLSSKAEFGLIFEDDAELISDLDLLELEFFLSSDSPRVLFLGWLPGCAIGKNFKCESFDRIVELIVPATCTFAYGLNKAAARQIVNGSTKIIDLADWPIFSLNKISFAAIFPPCAEVSLDLNSSTIGERDFLLNSNLIEKSASRLYLLYSFVYLCFYSLRKSSNFDIRQVMLRMIIKDQIYNYGQKVIKGKSNKNSIIFLPRLTSRLLRFVVKDF